MADEKGQVGSPSPTQPGPLPLAKARARLEGRIVLDRVARRKKREHEYYLQRKAAKQQAVKELEAAIARGEVIAVPPKPPKPKPPQPPQMVQVALQMRHSFNGRSYGPGVVTVSENKANVFLNAEHEAMAKEATLYQQHAYIINFRNGVPVRREVPASRFDDILAREELPIEDMGGRR